MAQRSPLCIGTLASGRRVYGGDITKANVHSSYCEILLEHLSASQLFLWGKKEIFLLSAQRRVLETLL